MQWQGSPSVIWHSGVVSGPGAGLAPITAQSGRFMFKAGAYDMVKLFAAHRDEPPAGTWAFTGAWPPL